MITATFILAALTLLIVLDDSDNHDNRPAIPVEASDRDALSR
jgi:hypothetical protein